MEKIGKRWKAIRKDTGGLVGLIIVLFFIISALIAPYITPYDPWEMNYTQAGQIKGSFPPNSEHWLGTTSMGRDVLSQLICGSRISLFIGFSAGIMAMIIGTGIGLFSGYYGGMVDTILMRMTDVVYSMPFLPFVVVLVSILGQSLWNVLLAIVIIIWRTTARVIRSEVLSLKERPFVMAAKVRGATDIRILFVHIAPNVLPLILLYAVFSMAWAILTAASINFLGFGDPDIISWGRMLYDVYVATAIRKAWWWFFPPGVCLAALIVSLFLVGRYFEETVNPRLRKY